METPEERKRRIARERAARYAARNPEKIKAAQARYRERNKEKRRKSGRERMAKYRREQPKKIKEWNDRYRRNHPERVNAAERARYARNPQRKLDAVARYRKANPEKCVAAITRWAKNNPEKRAEIMRRHQSKPESKARNCARQMKRHARKLQATVPWANEEKILDFYRMAALATEITGEPWEVDHIYPLISDTICGLHVEHNLRVIPAVENRAKGNRWG